MTMLVCPIFVRDVIQIPGAIMQARRAADAGASLVEWRVDVLATDDGWANGVKALLAASPVPCILTCRPTWEGGMFDGSNEERVWMFETALGSSTPPKYVDLELRLHQERPDLSRRVIDAIDGANGNEGVDLGLILSAHDFRGRPRDLIQAIEAMTNEPACSVIKVAWYARSLRDNLEAFAVLRERAKPTIALCMGEFGLMSRALAPKFGGFLTFASESIGAETAPGQATLAELRDLYRFDSIGRETAVYGVIGWPVGHSLGPKLHNEAFQSVGHDGVYLPLPIPPEYEHFKATVGALIDDPGLDFRGASVTLPHKAHLVRFVEERGGVVESIAKSIGAANTLIVREDGSIECDNTDSPAALDALCGAMDIDCEELAGRSVAVLGAGGAAKAVVGGLALIGAKVTIFNRTPGRAESLAMAYQGRIAETGGPTEVHVADFDQVGRERFDIVINCTPMGMAGGPAEGESPLPPEATLDESVTVFDTVYAPDRTPLIAQAEAAGARTVRGMDMFLRQAAMQFEIWTGRAMPLELVSPR